MRTKHLREERDAQLDWASEEEARGVVAVRLYAPERMSHRDASDHHEDIRYRVWMGGEYRVLTRAAVAAAKRRWSR